MNAQTNAGASYNVSYYVIFSTNARANVSDCTSVSTYKEKSVPISTGQNSERQSVSTLSPFASSFTPPRLFQKDYVVTSSQHGRSASVPRNKPTESSLLLAASRPGIEF